MRLVNIVFAGLETYSRVGGLQNFNRRIILNLAARALASRDITVTGFFLRDDKAAIPTIKGAELFGESSGAVYVYKILAAIRRADVLMVGHINLLPIVAIARVMRPSLQTVLFVHGDEVWNDPAHRLGRRYEPMLLRLVNRVSSVSKFTSAVMMEQFRVEPEKFFHLPNAVDPIATNSSEVEKSQRILTVTRISNSDGRKNVDKVLRAVASLKDRLPHLRYDIVGDGDLRAPLESLARDLGIAGIVTFHGRVDDATLKKCYEAASVFALPSVKEGFGIVYLEAWQYGLPVICSDRGAPAEIIDDGVDALGVDADDVNALAAALYRVLSQPDHAREMGEAGKRKTEKKYLNSAFRERLSILVDSLAR